MVVSSALNASYVHVNSQTSSSHKEEQTASSKKSPQKSTELSAAQRALIAKLQATDTKVKAHENAHIAAGGGVILSGANYTYEKGPDDALYAVGGEVGIDTSPDNTPDETISKMQIVRGAALAPADPSATDYQVASTASMLEMQARLEASKERQEALRTKGKEVYNAANNEETQPLFSNYA